MSGFNTLRKHLPVGTVLVLVMCFSGRSAFPESTAFDVLDPNMAVADPSGEWLWYDAQNLTVEGRGWTETEAFYHRLPAKAKGVVRDPVWQLSTHSAGICVRFISDANAISARWKVQNSTLAMPHMPATGVSGLDLYVNDNGVWRWIGNGRPQEQETKALLASGIPEGEHEYLLYLPLYNGTASLELGIPPDNQLASPPKRPKHHSRPVVFYGTSITQGGCASRPGMAYPAILGRRLGVPVINLGFSGNGKMEAEMAALLGEIDASAYVLDCLPNMTPELMAERVRPFIDELVQARPGVPIVLVESIYAQSGAFLPDVRKGNQDKNTLLQELYEQIKGQDQSAIAYVKGETLLGSDGESTVDGVHPTDLGFVRIADAIEPALRNVLPQ